MENTDEKKDVAGRPTLLTEGRAIAIIDDIYHRVPYVVAAEANGICEDTLYRWIKEGARDRRAGLDTPLSRFSEGVKKAEQKRIKEHLNQIANKPERWQADAWILERRWWKHFSQNAALLEMNRKMDAFMESQGNGKAEEMDSESNQS